MTIISSRESVEQSNLPLTTPTDPPSIISPSSPPLFVNQQQASVQVPSSVSKRFSANKPHRHNAAIPVSRLPAFTGIRQHLERGNSLCWVFAGDQMSGEAIDSRSSRPFSNLFAEFLHLGLHRLQDDVINVASKSTEHLLENIEERVLRFLPDIVSITLTFNDCQHGRSQRSLFRRRLQNIIEIVRQADAIPLLQTPYRIDPILHPQLIRLPAYVKIMREIASEEDVPCIDHWEHWKPLSDHPQKLAQLLSGDGLYLNDKGNIAAARLIIKRLRIECHLPEWCDDFSLSSQQRSPSQTMAVAPSPAK